VATTTTLAPWWCRVQRAGHAVQITDMDQLASANQTSPAKCLNITRDLEPMSVTTIDYKEIIYSLRYLLHSRVPH
jgi:hypothetical protein